MSLPIISPKSKSSLVLFREAISDGSAYFAQVALPLSIVTIANLIDVVDMAIQLMVDLTMENENVFRLVTIVQTNLSRAIYA